MKTTAEGSETVVAVTMVVICLSFKDRLTGVRGLAEKLSEKTDFDWVVITVVNSHFVASMSCVKRLISFVRSSPSSSRSAFNCFKRSLYSEATCRSATSVLHSVHLNTPRTARTRFGRVVLEFGACFFNVNKTNKQSY